MDPLLARRIANSKEMQRNAHTIVEKLDELERVVIELLLDGLTLFPPTKPSGQNYEEKNYYTFGTEYAAVELLQNGHPGAALRLVEAMLHVVKKYDERTKNAHNKGIIFGNLGVVHMALANVDAGGAYLIQAQSEDEGWGGGAILDTSLYKQFETPFLDWLNQVFRTAGNMVGPDDVRKAVQSLETNLRLILVTVGLGFRWNLSRYRSGIANDFVRSRLLMGLRDLCLIAEELLRGRARTKGVSLPDNVTLGQLLLDLNVLSRPLIINAIRSRKGNLTDAGSLQQLSTNVQQILLSSPASKEESLAQCFLVIWAVRNFGNHNIQSKDCWLFQNIEDVLPRILLGLVAVPLDIC